MNRRVLFVDDDPMLLKSMERCLGLRYEVFLALSGDEALAKLESSLDPAVVITDMRMPGMDGIEFVRRARPLVRDATFVMLTGNQDVHTAIRALNEGSVFRFLNKPCDPEQIARTIDEAIEQHRLVVCEKVLLNRTFLGAVGLFADVMEMLEPDLMGRAASAEQFLEALASESGAAFRWEMRLAAKLSMVGVALLTDAERSVLKRLPACSVEATALLVRAAEMAARLIRRVPRLDLVAEIVATSPTTPCDVDELQPRGDGDVVRIGAALLRMAQLLEAQSRVGVDHGEADRERRKLLHRANPALLEAAYRAYPNELANDGIALPVRELRAGMVLQNDLVRPDGGVLLRAGRRLTESHVEKLRSEQSLDDEPEMVIVTRVSAIDAFAPPEAAQSGR